VKAVREEEVKLRVIGFVKQVGFKPEVKERGSAGDLPVPIYRRLLTSAMRISKALAYGTC